MKLPRRGALGPATPPTGLVLAAGVALLAQAGAEAAIRFTERAEASGINVTTINGDPARKYIIETLGSGAALFDYDNDGDLDIYVANGSLLEPIPPGREPLGALYRNDGRGRFRDVTKGSGLAVPFWGFGVAAGDYDNDGDPDLYVTAWGPNHLFRNDGGGVFTDVAREAGADVNRYGTSAAFFDYDADGLLDLFVANYVTFDPAKIPAAGDPNQPCNFRGLAVMCGPHGLPGAVDVLYHNNGDGTFTDHAASAGLFTDGGYYGLGVVTADVDGDSRADILVANDSTPNHFYRNLGDGRFVDDGLMAGFAYSSDGREQAGMGIAVADVEGDGDLDVFVTNFSHDYCTLRLNDGQGQLEDVSIRVGLVEPTVRSLSWGTLLEDLDNDGDRDIFIANGHVYPEVDEADIGTSYRQRNQVFENTGAISFKEVKPDQIPALDRPDIHRSAAGGDLDNDGDVDILVTVMDNHPELLINESPPASWLLVRLVGRAGNRDGVGARVTVRAAGRSWMTERTGGGSYLASNDPRLHFGLGAAESIDSVEVRWPSGTLQTISRPRINRLLTVEEPPASSGPVPPSKPASNKDDSP